MPIRFLSEAKCEIKFKRKTESNLRSEHVLIGGRTGFKVDYEKKKLQRATKHSDI